MSLLFMSACTTTEERSVGPTDRERFLHYAGGPVSSFNYHGRIDRWRALGRDEVVVWTAMDQAYLLKIGSGCFNIESAMQIAVVSKIEGTVSSGFDYLQVQKDRCRIIEIRPIDYKLMQKEERKLREEK
jgi:hypothetical protein